MIKSQFKINEVCVTVEKFDSPFKNSGNMETYIFENKGKQVKTTVERLNATMREVATILLKQNINLI